MYAVYDMWPTIAKESFESKQKILEFDKFEHIVFAGMGGSGAIGDVFASILSKTKIHEHRLPPHRGQLNACKYFRHWAKEILSYNKIKNPEFFILFTWDSEKRRRKNESR